MSKVKKAKRPATTWAVFFSIKVRPNPVRSQTIPGEFKSKAAADKAIAAAKRKYPTTTVTRVALRVRNGKLVEPVRLRIIDNTPLVDGTKPQTTTVYFRIAYHTGPGYTGFTHPSRDYPALYSQRKDALKYLTAISLRERNQMGYIVQMVTE